MPIIRRAERHDIDSINYICRMTAGPKSIADEKTGKIISLTYSNYYARAEYESCFVLEDNGKTVGYIICAPDFKRFIHGYRNHEVKQLFSFDFRAGLMSWFLPLAYLPFSHSYPAHLHIDLLDGYRGSGNGSKMVNILLQELKSGGKKGVMLIVDDDNQGAVKFYELNGFHKIFTAFGGIVMGRKL